MWCSCSHMSLRCTRHWHFFVWKQWFVQPFVIKARSGLCRGWETLTHTFVHSPGFFQRSSTPYPHIFFTERPHKSWGHCTASGGEGISVNFRWTSLILCPHILGSRPYSFGISLWQTSLAECSRLGSSLFSFVLCMLGQAGLALGFCCCRMESALEGKGHEWSCFKHLISRAVAKNLWSFSIWVG